MPLSDPDSLAKLITDAALDLPVAAPRRLIALAGPPGAGKSTIAAAVLDVAHHGHGARATVQR